MARWALMLEEYDYVIEHRAGTRMKLVYTLSRATVMIVEDRLISVIMKILKTGMHENYIMEGGILKKFIYGKNCRT